MPSNPFLRSTTHCRRAARLGSRGFTMMELLVVLGILALLASLAITNVTGIFGGAQKSTASLFVKESMKTTLFTYRLDMGGYPTTAEGLQALITPPAKAADRWRKGGYIEGSKLPLDPWGEPYQYRYPGVKNKEGYDLWSKGEDKMDGTEDDIGNWEKDAAPAK